MPMTARAQQFLAMRDNFAPQQLAPLAVPEPPDVSAGDPRVGGMAGGIARGGPNGLVDYRGVKINGRTLKQVESLAGQFPGLRPTSGYRDPQHNARVGGVKNSHHLGGDATDWVGSAKDMYAAKAWAEQHGAREVLVHNVGSGQHLHVAW